MNILITGNLNSLVVPLVNLFAKDKNRVILASYNANKLKFDQNNVKIHSISPSESIFKDALSSYNFDAVLYLSTREEQLDDTDGNYSTGEQLDGLRNTLELCKHGLSNRFIFVSSTEVYGDMKDVSESDVPQPASINGYTLSTAEKYCQSFQDKYAFKLTILHVPNVYGPDEKTGLLYKLVKDGNAKKEIVLPDIPDTDCSFLHADDVVDFIKRSLEDEFSTESLVVNLSSSKTMKYSDLADLLEKYFSRVSFKSADKKNVYTRPVSVSTAKKMFDWVDTHELASDMENYIELSLATPVARKTAFQSMRDGISAYQTPLKWIELVLGAALAHYLSQLTGTLIQFKYVDFRLLFVVIMGSVYGLQFGLLSAVLISLSVLYTWFQLGFDRTLLIYNVGNWFPFALYFAAGLITGYNHDKSENAMIYEQKQTSLIYDKYAFLYEVFNEIRDLKDEFRERLIGYRDSFGRIFTITHELDELQEHVVYFKALNILEEIMENKSIAIYSLDKNQTYGRLEVSSPEMAEGVLKSLKLADFPKVLENIKQGIIYQNTPMLANYPAYVAPVMNNSSPSKVPVAIIVVWSAKFDQYSTYYYNLFKVICGLIQDSLVRVALFLDANAEKIYMPATRILKQDAFMDTVKVLQQMKNNKVLDFQLIKLEKSRLDPQGNYSQISKAIRTTDIVGMRQDGTCFVLLTQSNKRTSMEVVDRLEKLEIKGQLIESQEINTPSII